MSGIYTFYVTLNTTGSTVESVHNFLILTNAPGLAFSSGLTIVGEATSNIIGRIIRTPQAIGSVYTSAYADFSRAYGISGSFVGSINFIPYGTSNSAT
jgi:hypothetical protein